MKYQLMKKIREIIDGHKAFEKSQYDLMYDELKTFKDPAIASRYTRDGLKETILEIISKYKVDWLKGDKVFNQKLQDLIQKSKEKILDAIDPKINKPADYELMRSNALKFIELRGKEITDNDAFLVLKNFVADHDQMKIFRIMIETQKGFPLLPNSNGISPFPKTFGALEQYEKTIEQLDGLSENAAPLFLTKKITETESFVGGNFEIPTIFSEDEYTYQEENVLGYGSRLDALLKDVSADDLDEE